ncbi:MAG: hypothetical protein J0L99_08845 [Chitinophagales bacterium]|nr:hypothetical protein [Chitinophagales bacterium]
MSYNFCFPALPNRLQSVLLKCITLLCLFAYTYNAEAQQPEVPKPARVRFTVSNPSLSARQIDIRYFNKGLQIRAGYGYTLNALGSHAINMPVGARIYVKKRQQWELAIVIGAGDEGRNFNLSRLPELTREQCLSASYDEMDEANASLEAANEIAPLEAVAATLKVEMVYFIISGKSLINKQVYVRADLPAGFEQEPHGFGRSLNIFSRMKVGYPVGTKLYLCEGPYWNGTAVKETLVLTVDPEKNNYLIRL